MEEGIFHDFKLESTFNQSSKTSMRLNLSFVLVQLTAKPIPPWIFAFLNGLQNGRNYIWGLSSTGNWPKNIRLSLSYEGRKTGTANVVHAAARRWPLHFKPHPIDRDGRLRRLFLVDRHQVKVVERAIRGPHRPVYLRDRTSGL